MRRAVALAILTLTPAVVVAQDDPEAAPRSRPAALPDLVEPDAQLEAVLGRLRQVDDPQRHLARSFVSVLHDLLRADPERLIRYFHPQLQQHVGGGRLEAIPPEVLRERLAEREATAGPAPGVEVVLDVSSVRVYSRQRALAVDPKQEGWGLELARIGKLMHADDWLVIGRTKESSWGQPQAFLVFRRDEDDPHGRYKVVLSD